MATAAETSIVEALLANRAEAHVVLPFEVDAFRSACATQSGPSWLNRFDECLRQARVTQVSDGDYAGDPEIFAHASRLAMGMAMLRAQNLATDIVQIAAWDGREARNSSGTWRDVREWKSHGLDTVVVESEPLPENACEFHGAGSRVPLRKVCAIIFGDFEHFSRLKDMQMVTFTEHVMQSVARVLDRYDEHIVKRNTWGDGLFIVLNDVVAAARCALDIQFQLARLDLVTLGLPATLALRIGLHAGAVFEVEDPILKSIGFTGTHICHTARIEPNTPPGEVYVTEAFAALLMLCGGSAFSCDYVGLMNAPKGYGRLRTYLLRAPGEVGAHGLAGKR
jgi:adenylate cyclase